MTKNEYVEQNKIIIKGSTWNKPGYHFEYSEPLFDCPECGGDMRKNLKHGEVDSNGLFWNKYVCDRCNYSEYLSI